MFIFLVSTVFQGSSYEKRKQYCHLRLYFQESHNHGRSETGFTSDNIFKI